MKNILKKTLIILTFIIGASLVLMAGASLSAFAQKNDNQNTAPKGDHPIIVPGGPKRTPTPKKP